jgi:hypothetical protein
MIGRRAERYESFIQPPQCTQPALPRLIEPAPLSMILSKTGKHDFAARTAAFDQRVSLSEIGRIDCPQFVVCGGSNDSRFDEFGDLIQQIMLLENVGRVEQRAREHEFPVQRSRLLFERPGVERVWVVDDSEFPLRLIRTFTSTGLTEIARTSTTRSRCAATGTGSSISSSADGFSIGSDCWYPTAFIVLFLSNQRWISFAISAQ